MKKCTLTLDIWLHSLYEPCGWMEDGNDKFCDICEFYKEVDASKDSEKQKDNKHYIEEV